jgi:hypothetical protein
MSAAPGLICPRCGGTFRAGFERCATCKVDLVDRATYDAGVAAMDDPLKALKGKKTVAVVHASLPACREIERALLDKGIACALVTDAEEGDVLAAGAMKIGVIVAEEDLPRVADLMKARFESLIHKEGVGTFRTDAIDVGADEVECPACGHKGPLKAGACADCDLFLGAPE